MSVGAGAKGWKARGAQLGAVGWLLAQAAPPCPAQLFLHQGVRNWVKAHCAFLCLSTHNARSKQAPAAPVLPAPQLQLAAAKRLQPPHA